MLKLKKFTGINNQLPPERMAPEDLVAATNVDIGLTGEISRRSGYQLIHSDCHKNLFEARDFLLATVNHDKSRCYAINDRDLKNSCLAQVGNDKSRCYSIQDRDQKQQCLAEF